MMARGSWRSRSPSPIWSKASMPLGCSPSPRKVRSKSGWRSRSALSTPRRANREAGPPPAGPAPTLTPSPTATPHTALDRPRPKAPPAEKPYRPRPTASGDSQSGDTPSGGEQRGRDNAKNVDGRKRHIVVDSMGLLLAVLVAAAHVDDAKAAAELFGRLEGQPMGKVRRMFADTKYHNFTLYEWVEENARWDLSIVRRPDDAEGWVKLPIRWTVERTFAWLGKCRRLSKDRERSVRSSEAFIKLAMIHLMPNRLEPKETDAEFHYRTAA